MRASTFRLTCVKHGYMLPVVSKLTKSSLAVVLVEVATGGADGTGTDAGVAADADVFRVLLGMPKFTPI